MRDPADAFCCIGAAARGSNCLILLIRQMPRKSCIRKELIAVDEARSFRAAPLTSEDGGGKANPKHSSSTSIGRWIDSNRPRSLRGQEREDLQQCRLICGARDECSSS